MSAEAVKTKRPSYFKELDNKYVQSRGAMLIRSLLMIALGLFLLAAPRDIVEIALVVARLGTLSRTRPPRSS